MTKLTPTPQTAKFSLLNQMAEQAYDTPIEDREELIRKLWEDMCKRLSRDKLRVESVNYHLFRETKLIELTNKTA